MYSLCTRVGPSPLALVSVKLTLMVSEGKKGGGGGGGGRKDRGGVNIM